jgi:hypothetical protein
MTEAKKRSVTLQPERMQTIEYARRDWVVNAEENTSIDDVLDPMYWAHVSVNMRPFDRIEVRLETGEWVLELLVTQCDRNWAKVHVLHKHDLVASISEAPPATRHMVKWRGPQHKFCVVRIADSEVLQTGFGSAEEGAQWLRNYEQTVT